jgi:hypothetical protein
MNQHQKGQDAQAGTRPIFIWFMANFSLFALASYAVLDVPLQWLAHIGVLCGLFYITLRDRIPLSSGVLLFIGFCFWITVVTGLHFLFNEQATVMPKLATTSLPIYLGLRFLTLFAFFGWWMVAHWLLQKGYRGKLTEGIVLLGALISLYSLYVYYAQTHGWPELPRSRVGTSGHAQKTVFTYAFHRAMGTFREPSHLAEWLILPFFLGLDQARSVNWRTMIMGTTLLLTGSLTGIIGAAAGLAGALVVASVLRARELAKVARTLLLICLTPLLFSGFVASYDAGTVNLIGALSDRITPILMDETMQSSNRDYVYHYFNNTEMSAWGEGLGLSNLHFSKALEIEATSSFLSLYINTALSGGYVGIVLLILFLALPLLQNLGRASVMITGAYIAWLIAFAVHAEEFMAPFGVIMAYLTATNTHTSASLRG